MASIIKSNTYADFNGREILTANNDGALTTQKINYPAFHAKGSSSFQTLTASTSTKLTFGTEIFDEGGDYDAANSKFVCSVAGRYYFTYKFEGYSSNNTLYRTGAFIFKNGVSQYDGTQTYQVGNNNIVDVMDQNYILDLVADDYVEIYGRLQVGSGTTNRIYYKEFMGFRMGS